MAAFRTIGEVTGDNYKNVFVPAVTELGDKIEEINFLFLIDTEIKNFTAAALMEDALLAIKNFGKCNRTAIVTDSDTAISLQKLSAIWFPENFVLIKRKPITRLCNKFRAMKYRLYIIKH